MQCLLKNLHVNPMLNFRPRGGRVIIKIAKILAIVFSFNEEKLQGTSSAELKNFQKNEHPNV